MEQWGRPMAEATCDPTPEGGIGDDRIVQFFDERQQECIERIGVIQS